MRRLLVSLILVLVATLPATGIASAQSAPRFQLGFETLAQLIPRVVGSPLETERFDPATGDSIQRTTTGVMVWRKADNITAFTDGSTTWLLGPLGLQSRPNNTRFDWEKSSPAVAAPVAPSAASGLAASAVSIRYSRSGGFWVGDGTVRNSLGSAMDAEIDFVGYDAQGRPVIDTPTIFVSTLAPGATRRFTVRVPAVADVTEWKTNVSSWATDLRANFTVDVGGSSPLKVDPALADAVNALKTLDEGRWLLKVAADHDVTVSEDYAGPGVLGSFDTSTSGVAISTELETTSAYARAAVLAHELSHANNAAAGLSADTPLQCYREEAQAFTRQSQVWSGLWDSRLPSDRIDEYHFELNDIATTVTKDPQGFASQLVSRYRSECGPISAPPSAIMLNP